MRESLGLGDHFQSLSTVSFPQTDTSVRAKFFTLKNSLYSTVFVSILGGILFILCSAYIVDDKKRAEEMTKLNELGVMEAVEENIQVARLGNICNQ